MGHAVVHFEIEGLDGEALQHFYGELFDWQTTDAGASVAYGLVPREDNLTSEGIGIGGAICTVPDEPSSSWRGPRKADGYTGHVTIYVEVPDVGAALAQAESLGGKRIMGPDQIPGGPEIGVFTDPNGNLIGVTSSAA